jgi:phosphoribosylformylglycinamidine synthase
MDFKQAGDLIYIAGKTANELGGSEYFRIHGFTGNRVPKVNPARAKEIMDRLSQATNKGLVSACHDCSDGGIGVAVAEMAFAGGLGATIRLKSMPLAEPMDRDDFILFSESNSRFVVAVSPHHQSEFEALMASARGRFARIGEVNNSGKLVVHGLKTKVVEATLASLKDAWQKPIKW